MPKALRTEIDQVVRREQRAILFDLWAQKIGLVGLGPLFELLELVLWTGQVEGEHPVSILVVAPVGAGKTSLLEKLQCNTARYITDVTSRKISRYVRQENVTHLVLGDILSLFGHRTSVVDLSCRSLAVLTGETMITDPADDMDLPEGRQMGFISAIPPGDLMKRRIRSKLDEGGFVNRMLVVKFDYKPATVAKIHEFIKSDLYTRTVFEPLRIPVGKKPVQIDLQIGGQIESLARAWASGCLGTREHHHLRALAKASALQHGREAVDNSDYRRVEGYMDFFVAGRLI